ncbi:MAG TPA: AAA family ATPase [Solirubrobacterales bacterium]|jgi:DNA-binding CsgD family transcriptional regulator|nr:AAA family ATPase [Solirubrobacterales bacterium]
MPATQALLERDDELATIERVLAAAASGEGGLLTIEGEAGAGKSALLDAAAERGAGMTVLRARGGEFERDFPYGVVRQLFEPLLADPARRDELLGVSAAVAPVFDPAAAPAAGGDPFAIQHGLYGVVLALAETAPLLILVDDAQWADPASLRVLAYLGRRIDGQSAALVAAVRCGEPGGHEPMLDELRRETGALALSPAPLSPAAATVLLARMTDAEPEDGLAAACCEATAGNPFLMVELLRALDSEQDGKAVAAPRLAEVAARGMSRTVLTRLARLGDEAVAVARAVAVLEPHAEGRRIATLSGLGREAVAAACEGLVVANLLTDTAPVGFVHPLIRAAVLDELPRPRLAADHAEAARLLSEDGAAADAVAAHLLLGEARADPWAFAQLRAAATEARGRGAAEAAVTYLRRALREPPPPAERAAVSRELGVSLLLADEPEGIEVLTAVRAGLDDPVAKAEIAAELSVSLAFRRPGGEGVAMLEESLAEVRGISPSLALFLRGHLLIQLISGMERIPASLHLEPDAWPTGDSVESRVVMRLMAFLFAIGYGSAEQTEEIVERINPDIALYAVDVEVGLPAHYVYMAQALIDQGQLVGPYFEAAFEASERRGTLTGLMAGYGARACCRFVDGELGAAESDAELALRLIEQTGLQVQIVAWAGLLLKVHVAKGDLAAAVKLLDRIGSGRDPGPGIPGAVLLIARGEVRLARGLPAEARHDFLAAAERLRWLPYPNPELLGWRLGLAEAEEALGNHGKAVLLAEQAVRLAREVGGRRGVGIALRGLGSLTPGEEGIELLREAATLLGQTRARLQYAVALADLGAALRRANRRGEAREPLREALDLAARCGARALEVHARVELEATGARPRRAVLTGVESLTPSELRAARMAAGGMTNREIAQSLFVTAKTVETHLRHVYQKLDVAKRTDLAGALGEGEA